VAVDMIPELKRTQQQDSSVSARPSVPSHGSPMASLAMHGPSTLRLL
jgi:hypothetical protein